MDRDQILRLLRERIVAFAASRYRREMAEDVAQEVLRLIVEKYPHVNELQELLPLSLQIARFHMMSVGRTSYRRGEHNQAQVETLPLPDPASNPEEIAVRNENVARLKAAIASLGERCRDLMRYKLEGRNFPEIQRLFQAPSINTIYTWDFRCRKQLLEKLGGSWLEGEK